MNHLKIIFSVPKIQKELFRQSSLMRSKTEHRFHMLDACSFTIFTVSFTIVTISNSDKYIF